MSCEWMERAVRISPSEKEGSKFKSTPHSTAHLVYEGSPSKIVLEYIARGRGYKAMIGTRS